MPIIKMTVKHLLLFILGVGVDTALAAPAYLIIETDVAQTESVVEQLQSNADVTEVRRLFDSKLLIITTDRPEALKNLDIGRIYINQVLDTASTGHWASPDKVTVTEPLALTQPAKTANRLAAPGQPTDDPLSIFQWAYQNFGYDRGITGPAIADVDTGAHAVLDGGAGVTVAMVTTGADYTHEDLVGALWTNDLEIPNNTIDDDGNGFVDDVYGPGPYGTGDTFDQFGDGTALTGIIAARSNNQAGITGIAPGAKVLACNATVPTGQISVADLLMCIDYVIFQKTVRDENIPIFVFTVGRFKPFDQIIEPALRALMDADIIVVAATYIEPPGYAGINLDHSTDTPATADFPNIISVNALDRNGLFAFKSRGRRVIDVSAPGIEILATLPGFTAPQDSSSFLFEDLETMPSDWNLSGGWEHSATSGYGDTGGMILTTGAGTFFDESQIVELPAMNLSGLPGPRPWFSFKLWAENMVDTESPGMEGMVDLELWYGGNDWWPIKSNNEYMAGPAWQTIKGYLSDYQLSQVDLTNIRLRFRAKLTSNHSPIIRIDELGIGTQPSDPGYSNNYGFYNGTAPAAAIVGAMAAVIKSERPELSNTEVRNLLVGSGPSITEIVSNISQSPPPPPMPEFRFPRLWTSDGRGSLQCSSLITQRRTMPPITRTFVRGLGQPLLTRAISIDCEHPGQATLASADNASNTFSLRDDGQFPDTRAQDGEFAGHWTSDSPINETLTFTNDSEPLNVLALDDYEFTPVPFQWREIDKENPPQQDWIKDPPFPLLFGDLVPMNGFQLPIRTGIHPRIHYRIVDGYLPNLETIPGSPVTIRNSPEQSIDFGQFHIDPAFSISELSYPEIGGSFGADAQVQGSSPHREWIIEWSNYSFKECADVKVGVQIVFFEQSPDVLVNYRDVGVDCAGELPKLLIQYNVDSWVTYDSELAPAISVLLSPRRGSPNLAPVVDLQIPNQILTHGQTLTLDLTSYFSDPDGDSLSYFLGKNQEFVTVDPSGLLTARFPVFSSTDIPVSTIQVVAYDGRQATRTNFDVSFDDSQNLSPVQVTTIPEIFMPSGSRQLFDISPYFQDADLDPLEYIIINDPLGAASIWGVGEFVFLDTSGITEGQQFNIDFLVSDGQLSVQSTLAVSVTAGSALPPQQISAIPDQSVRVGEYLLVPLYQYFEPDFTYSFRFTQSQGPSSVRIDAISDTYNFVPTEQDRLDGPYEVQIKATRWDAPGETIVTFNLEITPENQPPTFAVNMPIDIIPGSQIEFNLNNLIIDPDGDNLSFVVGQLPVGLQQDSETYISGSLLTEGQYTVPIRITDDFGASLVSLIEINVAQPSSPPPPTTSTGGGGGGSTGFAFVFSLLLVAIRQWRLF